MGKTADIKENLDLKKGNALYAKQSLRLEKMRSQRIVHKNVRLNLDQETSVYTLTVEGDNVYYANGYLVENCIAMRCFFEIKPVHQTTFISFK